MKTDKEINSLTVFEEFKIRRHYDEQTEKVVFLSD